MARGEVRRLRMPGDMRGGEPHGPPVGGIVQADVMAAPTAPGVAPTARPAPPRSFRPAIDLGGDVTRVLVEQTTAVSTDRLGTSAGRLTADELRALDEALVTVFGL